MTDLALAGAPSVPGLSFRQFRGEEDFPAMLRVYTAAHEADGIEEVTLARPAAPELFDARQLRSRARHDPGGSRGRAGCLRAGLLERPRRGRPLVRELRIRPPRLASAGNRRRDAPAQRAAAARDRGGARRRRAQVVRLRGRGRRPGQHRAPPRKRLHPGSLLLRDGGADARRPRCAADARRDRAAPCDARPVPHHLARFRGGVPRSLGPGRVDRGGLDSLRRRPRQRRSALLAHRLGWRGGGGRGHHHGACRGERAARSGARLRRQRLRPATVAPTRPGSRAARQVARRGPRGGVHVGQPWRRHG